MADKEQDYRIFVGGLSWDVTERQLESAFGRFGKIVDRQAVRQNILRLADQGGAHIYEIARIMYDSSTHIMLERDTGRPRGFGFLTFADRRGMEDAIRDMDGREFGDRVISVNKAQPKGAEDAGHGYGNHTGGGRGSHSGRDRPAGQDDCFKCGRPGHWARDCPSAGGGRGARPLSPPRSKYGGAPSRGDRYADDRDRYMDDRYDRGRYGDRDRYDSREDRYGGGRDRYVNDRYPPAVDRFGADRYAPSADRYPHNGYGKDRVYDKDGGARGAGDRYGGGGGPARYDGKSYRERPAPYERPRRGGRPPSLERY